MHTKQDTQMHKFPKTLYTLWSKDNGSYENYSQLRSYKLFASSSIFIMLLRVIALVLELGLLNAIEIYYWILPAKLLFSPYF